MTGVMKRRETCVRQPMPGRVPTSNYHRTLHPHHTLKPALPPKDHTINTPVKTHTREPPGPQQCREEDRTRFETSDNAVMQAGNHTWATTMQGGQNGFWNEWQRHDETLKRSRISWRTTPSCSINPGTMPFLWKPLECGEFPQIQAYQVPTSPTNWLILSQSFGKDLAH